MSYRIVMRPDGNLGVFNDATDKWVDEALGDGDAADLLADAEDIEPDDAAKIVRQVRAGRVRKEHDGYVMTWEEAEWRTGGRHGNQPLARDRKGDRIRKHGLGGYARGCRCDVCLKRDDEDSGITHGYSGYVQGCRCDVCTDAKAAFQRSHSGNPRSAPRPPMLDSKDVRDQAMTLMASEREQSLIIDIAAEDGMAASTWIMDLLQPVLEERRRYVSPRRPAPRRPNRQREEGAQS